MDIQPLQDDPGDDRRQDDSNHQCVDANPGLSHGLILIVAFSLLMVPRTDSSPQAGRLVALLDEVGKAQTLASSAILADHSPV